jgi:hypothetical protein
MTTNGPPPPPEQWWALMLALLLGILSGVYVILGKCVYQWYQVWMELFS